MLIEFRPSSKASAHGGQLATAGVLSEFGLWRKVQSEPALDPRSDKHKGFDPEVYVAAFLFNFTSGGVAMADAERLDEDMPLKSLLGLEKLPDQSALGEWLRNIGEPGWRALRRLNREFSAWILARIKPERLLMCGRLECFFDDTQIEVQSPWFEGAAINYEGNIALSWQTLWVGPLLVDGVLGATSQKKESMSSENSGRDVSNQLPSLLQANRHLWEGFKSYLYADSASSAGKYLEALDECFDGWSVSYNRWTEPLEAKARELPDLAWSPMQWIEWRDKSQHQAQYAWFRYQPSGCDRPQVFAVVRHRAMGEMFWRHAFITCEDRATTAQAAFEQHRLKGDWERRFSELLSDLQLHHPPCQNLAANNCFYALAALAYNALQALKLLYLPDTEQTKRIRTLIHQLLLIPVEMGRHARQLKACLYAPAGWVAWWLNFLRENCCRSFA